MIGPDGGKWTPHTKDIGHWPHWDGPNGETWSANANKPRPGQKIRGQAKAQRILMILMRSHGFRLSAQLLDLLHLRHAQMVVLATRSSKPLRMRREQ